MENKGTSFRKLVTHCACPNCKDYIKIPVETRLGEFCSEECAEKYDINYLQWLEAKGLL